MGEDTGRLELDYERTRTRVIEFLSSKRAIVLATSLHGLV